MAITIAKENYPQYSADTGVSGKRQVLYINYGATATPQAPKWVLVGGLKSHTLSVSAETSTVQTKDTGYWATGATTSKSYELTADILMKRDDTAQLAIEEFLMNDEITAEKGALNIAIVDLDTKEYINCVVIPTSWETTADGEDLIQKSLTATGIGAPEKKTGFTVGK